jgi:muramoyltetrapeptide carboxypeptidase LdcA involved in peptidoglycan recycling
VRGEQTKALILELERLQGIEDQKNRFEGLAEERAHIAQSIMDAVSEDIIMAGNFSIFWGGFGVPKVLRVCPWHASIRRVHAQRKILYQLGITSSSFPCTATHNTRVQFACMHHPCLR